MDVGKLVTRLISILFNGSRAVSARCASRLSRRLRGSLNLCHWILDGGGPTFVLIFLLLWLVRWWPRNLILCTLFS